MPENPQNVKCGWTGCTHQFGSEIDMNMHVMMNHMIILDHGEFNLNRRAVNRKRPRETAREESIGFTEEVRVNNHSRELRAVVKREPVSNGTTSVQPHREATQPREAVVPLQAHRAATRDREAVNHQETLPRISEESFRPPRNEGVQVKVQRVEVKPTAQRSASNDFRNVLENLIAPIQMPPDILIPAVSPESSHRHVTPDSREIDPEESDVSPQNGEEQTQNSIQNQLNLLMGIPPKLSDIIDDFLKRLKPMKQLGFIRPDRTVYCVVCLKYVKSFHECNWKHTPGEDRVAEMWYRRFGKEKPNGKNQLMKELEEIKQWVVSEEHNGNLQEINE